MRKGFTLVEMSIVLVVIGLLIGGILVGQSLIESAKINRLVSNIGQYEVAVIQFYKKFKKYPGDSPYFIPPGNGNNIIESAGSCAAAPNAAYSNWEQAQIWGHLSQAQMLSKNYSAFSPISCGGTHNNTYSSPTNDNSVYAYTEFDSETATTFGLHKQAILTYKNSASRNFLFDFFVNPSWVAPLQKKMDGKTADYTETQIGLTNNWGIDGMCYDAEDEDYGSALCTSEEADYGEFRYLIPPQN